MAVVLVLLLLAAGAVAFAAMSGSDDPSAPAAAGPASGASEGVLSRVEETQLTLQPRGGGAVEIFGLRPIDRGRIDLFHLVEHVRQRWPVRVSWETVDGTRYATDVDDLPQ